MTTIHTPEPTDRPRREFGRFDDPTLYPRSHGGRGRGAPTRRRRGGASGPDLAVAAFAAVWLAASWSRIAAPLGLSHDGQNGGVFGSSARAFVDDPIGSHLGSHLSDGHGVYANHPPLLNWLLALGHAVAGESTAGLRVPLLLGSLLLIVVVHRTLLALDLSPWAAAAGTIGGLGAPMFFVYGTMADTPMLALPFGALLVHEVVIARRAAGAPAAGSVGRSPAGSGFAPEPWRLVAAAALCALASWEAVLLALVLAAGCGRSARPITRRVLGGLVLGLAVTVPWILWAYDGIGNIQRSFLSRTGATAAAFGVEDAVVTQLQHVFDTYGVLLPVALLCVVPAMRLPSMRWILPLVGGVCLAYQVGFWQAATCHDYWSYWFQLPMALALGGAVDVALRRSGGSSGGSSKGRSAGSSPAGRRRLTGIVALGIAALGVLTTVAGSSKVERSYEAGLATADLVERTPRPSDQDRLVTLGLGTPNSWASWGTGLAVEQVDLRSLPTMAAQHPGWQVIGLCDAPRDDGGPDVCAGLPDGVPRAGQVAVTDAATWWSAVAPTLP